MAQKIKVNKIKHNVVSVRLPHNLYKQLEAKAEELGEVNISETIRTLLGSCLESRPLDRPLQYAVMAYCLMEKFLSTSVKEGKALSSEAHSKAEQIINSFVDNK